MSDPHNLDNPITLTIGHEQLIIRRRYEVVSIINDFFIAIWFLLGSVFFLYPSLEKAAVWLFIIGSFQFLIRPTIRLLAHIHIQRVPDSHWQM
ncbi:MAG: YrhK family protein [Marinobacter sp.]